LSRPPELKITSWSIGAIIAVAVVSFWTMTAAGERYMQPGGLRGEHVEKKMACDACHEPLLGTPDAKCVACHKRIGQEQATRQGRHAAMRGACYRCHIAHQATNGGGIDKGGVDHSLVGFILEKHESQKCGDCHGAGFKAKGEQINAACAQCHAWPQQTMGNDNPQAALLQPNSVNFGNHKLNAGDNCIRCHTGGANAAFKHASDPQGAHARLTCEKCHRGGIYGGLNWTCTTCHRSPHKGDIGGDCLKCHNQDNWSQTTMKHDTSQDCAKCHAAPPGHFSAACTKCHKNTGNWQANFQHPGIPEHSSTSYPCNYCHPAGNGSVDCRRCHDSIFPRGGD